MSNTSSTHTINVKTDIPKATKEAEGLDAALKRAANSAKRVATPVSAARQAKGLDPGAELGRESGMARSVGPGTGAAGRDFAKQSEGLGGLVRVYATFAANIFAATAAFGALSRAADTSNLVKGLDQLGAAAGRNLGSLAKQLVATADGAISLKDALTATAQASAGGMSNTNILKMGEVAKKAAQALGRDMPDALNRITRGITKLEPELLDEIGIMVRLDDATREYGKSIGKSALALTDFERRQAFANAVLEQGQKKFGNISLDANPYSKILASFQNLMQSGLELMNRVLGPIMGALSESPAALGLAIAAIAGTLIRQAIPAISGWKKGLDSAAKSARDAAVEANKLRKTAYTDEGVEAAAKRDMATKNAAAALDRLRKGRKVFAEAASFDMDKVTDADIANLRKVAAEQAKVDASKKDRADSTIERHNREQAMAAQAISSLETRAKEAKRLTSIEEEEDKKRDTSIKGRLKSMLTLDAASQRLADRAIAKSQRADIINAAVNDAAAKPYLQTLGDMYAAIGKARQGQDSLGKSFEAGHKRMGIFNAGLTAVKGTVLVTAGAISTLAASLGNVFAMIGIFVTIYQVLDSFLSNSAKEAAAFSSAISTLDSSLENVSRTIDFINKKDTVNIISIESTQARATALHELTEATKTAASSFSTLIASWETWDKIGDTFWDFLGKGSADKLSTSLAGTIVKAFQAVENGPAREAGIKAIESITKVKGVTNLKAINDELRNLSDSEVAMAAMEITRALDEMSKAAGKNAANLTTFQASLKETSDLSKTMIAGLRATDNESKLGSSLVDSAYALNTALESPIEGFKALKTLAKDVSSLSLIPTKNAEDLAKFSKELDNISIGLIESERAAEVARATLEEYQKILESTDWTPGQRDKKLEVKQDKTRVQKDLEMALAATDSYTKKMNDAVTRFKDIGNDIFKEGIDRMSKGLQTAMAEAAVSFNKTVSSIIKSVGGNTAESDTQLRAQELNIQKSLIEATYAQSKNAMLLTLTLEQTNLLMERETQENTLKSATNKTTISSALSAIAKIDKTLKDVGEKRSILNRSDKEAMRIAGDVNDPLYEAAKGLKGYFAELFGKNGKLAQIMSQEASNALQGRVDVIKEQTADASKSYDTMASSTAATKSNIEAQQALVGVFSKQLELRKQAAEEELRSIDYVRKQLKNAEDYRTALEVLNTLKGRKGSENQVADARDAAERASLAMKQAAAQFERETANAAISNMDRLLKGQADLARLESERSTKKLQDIFSIATIELDAQQAELAHRLAMGTMDEKAAVLETARIATAKESVEYANKLLGLESAKLALKLLERKVDQAFLAGAPLEELMDEYNAGADALQRQVDIINAGHRAKLVSIENTKKQGLEEAKVSKELKDQETLLDNLNDAANSMAAVFGEVGDSIGSVITAIGQMTIALTESGNKEKAIQDQLAKDRLKYEPDANDDGKDRIEKAKQLAKVEQKASYDTTQTKLDGYLAVASTAKSLFKEQSRGAQAMAKIEKTIHIAKLAMWVKEQLAAVTTSGTTITASLAAAGANSIKAITAAFAAPFPVGFVAGAAMIAIMSSLLGGKSKSVATPGFSAEEAQKVQGTGQDYVGGVITNTGGGALGDPTAKANSINNSIDKIKEHTFSTMEYSNDMLDNLIGIKKNTENLSALILQSGLNTKGMNPNGTTQFGTTGVEVQRADFGNYGLEKLANAIGISKDSGIGKLASKISTSIFGGKNTVELLDIGIAFEGSLGNIVDALKDGGKSLEALYQNIKTTKSGGWFRSDKTSFNKETDTLETLQAEAFGNIFADIKNSVIEAAEVLGKDREVSSKLTDSFNLLFSVSFKDLKPEELTAALESEFSQQFNKLSELILPEFQKFRKPAEEFGDTIVRLARDVQVTGFALEAAGLSIGDISDNLITTVSTTFSNTALSNVISTAIGFIGEEFGAGLSDGSWFRPVTKTVITTITESLAEARVRITENLIDLSGGLDAFVEKASFFKENFLTAAQQLEPVAKRVAAEMDRLGFASIDTRKEFADLVRSLDLGDTSTGGGQETYAALMNVAEGFAEVYPAIEETKSSLADLEKEFTSLTDTLAKATMGGQEYREFAKARDTKDATPAEIAQYDANNTVRDQIDIVKESASVTKLSNDILRAQGRSQEALNSERTEELRILPTAVAEARKLVHIKQDELKLAQMQANYAATDIDLLKAQGKDTEALTLQRTRELNTMSAAEQVIQKQIYARQDEIKVATSVTALTKRSADLEIELLKAQGKESQALNLQRQRETANMTDAEKELYNFNAALEDSVTITKSLAALTNRGVDLEIELLKAQGKEAEALNLERQRAITNMKVEEIAQYDLNAAKEEAIRIATSITAMTNATADLEVGLLRAQGKELQALNLERQRATANMIIEEKALYNFNTTLEDATIVAASITALTQRGSDLEIEILKAQGKETEALNLERQRATANMSFEEKALYNLNAAMEDSIKVASEATTLRSRYADLDISLLNTQGELLTANGDIAGGLLLAEQAIALAREREILATDPLNRDALKLIHAREDEITEIKKTIDAIAAANKTYELGIQLLETQGYSYAAVILKRELYYKSLSAGDAIIQRAIDAQEDLNKVNGLEIELLEASGRITEATILRRKAELRSLSAAGQLYKIRLWQLEDEKELIAKSNSQRVEMLNLLGDTASKLEALNITRAEELAGLDAQLRPMQQYIYALEDEAALRDELTRAYDEQKSSITSTIDALRSASAAIKEYKASLLQSDKSTLTPQQKYQQAKSEALRLAAVAASTAVTEAEQKAKDDALSKLPSATDNWLEASRTLFASSKTYTEDFSLATKLLDTVSLALDEQLSEGERQLKLIEDSATHLGNISTSTRSIAEITADLLIAINKTSSAKAGLPTSSPSVTQSNLSATLGESGMWGADDMTLTGLNGFTGTVAGIRDYFYSLEGTNAKMLQDTLVGAGIDSTMLDSILGKAAGTSLAWAEQQGLPHFSRGGMAIGRALVGEQGAEVVDFQTPGRVYSAGSTSLMMGNTVELVNEIKALRQEVAKLREEQREQTGHLIQTNYDANAKAAEKVVEGTSEASNNNAWKAKTMPKVA